MDMEWSSLVTYNLVVLLNLDLGISNQLGGVSAVQTYPFMDFSLIPLDDLSTISLFNPLSLWINNFIIWLYIVNIDNSIEGSCLMVLCLRRMCLDLPYYSVPFQLHIGYSNMKMLAQA